MDRHSSGQEIIAVAADEAIDVKVFFGFYRAMLRRARLCLMACPPTGDYSRPIRRLLPKTATVAEFRNSRRFWQRSPNLATVAVFGDNLSPKSATTVSSVDRPLVSLLSVRLSVRL